MRDDDLPDVATVIAIGVIAYAFANFLHEAVGHGGACLVVGGRPQVLSSVHFECAEDAVTDMARRFVSAGGTLVNFIAGAAGFAAMRAAGTSRPRRAYFLWLFTTINLLMGAGYFLFSGVGNIGDWAAVFRGLAPPIFWRPILALLGGGLYFLIARRASVWLRPLVGGGPEAMARARRLTLVPYLAGGALYCISGIFNPEGPMLIAISAAAASFGGASGLIWLIEFLPKDTPAARGVEINRSTGWIVCAALVAVIFIGVLGPSIRLG